MPNHSPLHDPQEFATRLKEAMADVGQNSGRGAAPLLAKRHKTSRVTASSWLAGNHLPAPDRVRAMAGDYGVRFEWLYFGQLPKRAAAQVMDAQATYTADPPLTPTELALLRNYRSSDEALRTIVDTVLTPKGKPTKKP